MLNLAYLRRTSLIALLAMVMLALAPTVSKVIASEWADPSLVEVCTAEGAKWVSASEPGQAVDFGHGHSPSPMHVHGGDCPYCSLQTTKFLVSVVHSCIASKSVALLPPLFYQAPKLLFAWVLQPARAPPLSA